MRFSLEQCSEIFRIRDVAGRPYILIGGQAVNYWAERYLPTESALAKLLPFTSEDIDFKGDREDVQRIAEQLKLSPVYPHQVAMTALAGAIPFRIGDLKSNIEIVRRVIELVLSKIELYYRELHGTRPCYRYPLSLSRLMKLCNRSGEAVTLALRILANTVPLGTHDAPPVFYDRIAAQKNKSHRPYRIYLRKKPD